MQQLNEVLSRVRFQVYDTLSRASLGRLMPPSTTTARWLARPADEITMDEVVLALEGSLAPMECFVDDRADDG